MKIIDHNGRLFGKISIIDVLVVAVVIVMAAALSVKGRQTQTSTSVTNEPITFQVQVQGVRTYVADAIQVGDLLYDPDYSTGGALGVITDIQVTPGTQLADFSDGTLETVPKEDCKDILLTVQGEGLISDGFYYLNRVYIVGVNASRNYYTKYVQFSGTVFDIL